MQNVHTYLFNTSILFANRQIYHEASHVLYLENLFVRVNSVTSGPFLETPSFAANRDYGHLLPLPIFSNESKVQACTRHVMEIDLFPCSSSISQERKFHFILAADDLPLLCRHLLWMDARYMERLLQQTELWIIIGDEVLNCPTYEKSAERLNAATKNASASRGEGPANISRRSIEGSACTSKETNVKGIARGRGATGNKLKLSGPPSLIGTPRLRRLLEPLRALHSIGSSYIDAPISERYRDLIQTSLFRARPGIQDLFLTLVSAFEEAMTTFRAGYSTLAVQQLRGTLDTWNELTCLYTPEPSTKLATGAFAGFTLYRALDIIRYEAFKTLTRAYLAVSEEAQRGAVAKNLARRIFASYSRHDQWGQGPHNKTMLFSMLAETWEALDQLGALSKDHPRSEDLRLLIAMLTTRVQHAPANTTLRQVLRRMQVAKAVAEIEEASAGVGEGGRGEKERWEGQCPLR